MNILRKYSTYILLTLTCGVTAVAQEEVIADFVVITTPVLTSLSQDEANHVCGMGDFLLPGRLIQDWSLHAGLNLQMEAGVRVGWGKGNPFGGASFFSNVGAMYAMPLSRDGRLTAAAGGYFSNYRLYGEQVGTLGLMAMVDYVVNQRVDVGCYVAHDFGIPRAMLAQGRMTPAPLHAHLAPSLYSPATTIGAQIWFKVGENAALRLNVSVTRENLSHVGESCMRQ